MITISHRSKAQTPQRNVNRHKTLLIMGAGNTSYRLNEIAYFDSQTAVENLYGTSELTDAFIAAKKIGAPHVFLANIQYDTDYIDMVDIIKQHDFTYIAPIGIKFSDTFYNPLLQRTMTYTELYTEQIGESSNALLMMTDNQASLYEDVDAFLKDMFVKITSFKNIAQKAILYGRNVCLVGNNLVDHRYANLTLAAAMCVTPLGEYPSFNFGKAVFDIDDFDVGSNELIYFKNNILVPTSVENLKNFRKEQDAAKIVNIDKVIKFIDRELDFTSYQGKMFTDYVKLKLYNSLKEFFEGNRNVSIRDYKIQSIEFVKTSAGAGRIVIRITIVPINSLEGFDIAMEV